MATDQVVVETQPAGQPMAHRAPSTTSRKRGGFGPIFIGVLVLAGLGVGGYFMAAGAKDREHSFAGETAAHGEGAAHAAGQSDVPRMEVVRPKRGGMERTTQQPGTVRAFDFAELYAKVSGYVKEIKVDRGSRVKKGDVLIELYVPELVAAVAEAKAQHLRSQAVVIQSKAQVVSAEEMVNARLADLEHDQALLRAKTARREYRDKQYIRISQLVDRGAVEERLRDEEEDRKVSAHEDEAAAKAGVAAARAHLAEARALLAQAKAELKVAEAEVDVSKANLDKEEALQSYMQIKSPYDGVVIFRGEAVHEGAFVRGGEAVHNGSLVGGGGSSAAEPLLTVAFDDLMRTIVPIPDRDVPYCDIGDAAIVKVDALNNREFKGTVSRIAESEDINDRTMRIEVDLPNPDRILRDGMYGRAEIVLEKSTSNLTVPSTAVIERDNLENGVVEVVRNGKMYRHKIKIGRDDGTTAEVISGLEADTDVVVQPDVSMADGTPVEIESKTLAEASSSASPEHS